MRIFKMDSSGKIKKGFFLGIVAGILDVIPMIVQNLTWDSNLSAFFHWVVAGILISTSNLKLSPVLKGLTISLLLLIPVGILVGWNDPVSLAPMFVMTIILGSLLGYFIER
ncbi:MAG: hypothetical protein R2741_09285 [Methanolobus sp.]